MRWKAGSTHVLHNKYVENLEEVHEGKSHFWDGSEEGNTILQDFEMGYEGAVVSGGLGEGEEEAFVETIFKYPSSV